MNSTFSQKIILLIISILLNGWLFAQISFNDYFINKTMRFDFMHAGNAQKSEVYFEQIKQEPFWGGSKKNLIDKFNYGQYLFFVYDDASNKLLYSRGFSTLFQEWQSTAEAKKINRSFYETIIFPFPKKKIKLEIQRRNKQNQFIKEFEVVIDPKDYFIKKENTLKFPFAKINDAGDPSSNFDLVILPDGYTKDEMQKFQKDADRFAAYLLKHKPYNQYRNKINIWRVDAVSNESGTDIPGDSVYKSTILNSTFYTFGTERYLTTSDNKSVRDVSSNVPYDQILVLVNTPIYGGGGFYNHYSLFSADHPASEMVFIHEFGHGFGSLADEYYTSDVAYEDYYDLKAEPYEPNITTLVNFEKKWKNMLDKNTPVPTPSDTKYNETIGAFEGGGYVAKGIYRPMINCIMNSFVKKEYCPVCNKAIEDMLKFYTE